MKAAKDFLKEASEKIWYIHVVDQRTVLLTNTIEIDVSTADYRDVLPSE